MAFLQNLPKSPILQNSTIFGWKTNLMTFHIFHIWLLRALCRISRQILNKIKQWFGPVLLLGWNLDLWIFDLSSYYRLAKKIFYQSRIISLTVLVYLKGYGAHRMRPIMHQKKFILVFEISVKNPKLMTPWIKVFLRSFCLDLYCCQVSGKINWDLQKCRKTVRDFF